MSDSDERRDHRILSRRVYFALLAASLLWCLAIIAAPLLHGGRWAGVSGFLYDFFHPICNQIDSHSFHIAGEKTGVCMRCSSIYFSFFVGLLVYPVFRSITNRVGAGRTWLLAAIAPMVVDVVLSLLNVHESSSVTRVLTGAFFGVSAVFVLFPIMIDASVELMTRTRVQPSPTNTKD